MLIMDERIIFNPMFLSVSVHQPNRKVKPLRIYSTTE